MAEIDDILASVGGEERDYDAEFAESNSVSSATAANDKSTVEAPTPSSGVERRARGALKTAGDVAITGLDAATLGAGRNAAGLFGMLKSIGGAEGNPFAAYNEGFEQADDAFEESREGLNLPMRLFAEVGGAVGGIPRLVDKGVQAVTRKFAPAIIDKVKNYSATYGADLAASTADRYMRNDESFEDAIKGGAIDAMIGVGAQAAVGDVALPFGQRLFRKVMGKTPLGQATSEVAQGSLAEGMTLENLYAASQNLAPGEGLLDLKVDGQPRWETARKFYNSVASTMFPNPNPRKLGGVRNARQRALFQGTVDTVRRYADEANEEAASVMEATWGSGGRSDPRARSAKQDLASKKLNSIGRELPETPDGPMPLGATTLNSRETVNNVQKHLEQEFGQNLTTMMKTQGDVWNAFVRSMRGQEVTSTAKQKRLIVSKGKDSPRADEVLPDMTLAGLYNTRREMADLLTPTGRIDNNPLTKTKRKTVVEIMSVLDDQIDELASAGGGDTVSEMRGVYAGEMRIKDAEEMGVKFYKQRSSGVDDEYMFTDHYRETLEDFHGSLNTEQKAAFRKGFTSAMSDMTGNRSVLTELGNYLGDIPTTRESGNILKEKKQGRDHLSLILGPEDAHAIVDMYTNGNQLIEFRGKLADLFDAKRGDPGFEAQMLGANMRPQDIPSRAEGGAMIEGLAWVRDRVLQKDRKKIDEIARLLTYEGKDLEKLLRKGVEQAAPGKGAQIGTRAAMIRPATELYESDEEVPPQRDIMELIREGMDQN